MSTGKITVLCTLASQYLRVLYIHVQWKQRVDFAMTCLLQHPELQPWACVKTWLQKATNCVGVNVSN